MGKKFYAVRKGLVPGIYTSWPDCQKNIKGFSGASYKGFETLQEAESFLGTGEKEECKEEAEAVAYVDGSYNTATKEYAYGVVLFHKGTEQHFCKGFSNPEMASMRNVAGEIEGARYAMDYCIKHGIKSLDIYYDYEGIEKWCSGEWKANKEGTKSYQDFYRKASQAVNIRFRKVKGHSGDTYNDLADELAKKAAGILKS